MIPTTRIARFLTVILVFDELVPGNAGEDKCFMLSQSLHSVKFEEEAVSKRIEQLHAQIASLTESETSEQSALAEHAEKVRQAQQSLKELSADATKAEMSLRVNEQEAENLKMQANETAIHLRSEEKSSIQLKKEIQDFLNGKEAIDSRIRGNELKVQMLVNDIDASNHTARDAWRLFSERLQETVKYLNTTKKLFSEVRRALKSFIITEHTYQESAEALEKTKLSVASAQEMLVSASRKKDEQQIRINRASDKLTNDRVQAVAKKQSLDRLRNDTISKSESLLKRIRSDIIALNKDLNVTETEVGRVTLHRVKDSIADRSPLDISALRESLKESRKMLAREGYINRFSFLQANGTRSHQQATDSLEEDVLLFRDSSKLLSIEEQLKELHSEIIHVQQSWNSSMDSLRSSENELRYLEDIQHLETDALLNETTVLDKIISKISSVEGGLTHLRSHLVDGKRSADAAETAWKDSKRKFDELFSSLVAANSTAVQSFRASQEALEDYHARKAEMSRLKRERSHAIEAEIADEKMSVETENNIASRRQDSAVRSEAIKTLSQRLEEQRKHHTEVMAVISQISRRLEDKLSAYEDENRRLKTEKSEVEDLESTIRGYLSERETINKKLDDEMKVKLALGTKVQELNKQIQSLKCDV
jgi:chromosome segregation ATPase